MPRERMLQAREHIKAKRYDEARSILKTIDHPKAKEWLAKVNKISPPAKRKRRIRPVIAIPLAIVVVIIVIVIAITMSRASYSNWFYNSRLPEARAILSGFCDAYLNIAEHRCTQWVNETFEEDIKRTFQVVTCDGLYNWLAEPQRFANCLAVSEVYMP